MQVLPGQHCPPGPPQLETVGVGQGLQQMPPEHEPLPVHKPKALHRLGPYWHVDPALQLGTGVEVGAWVGQILQQVRPLGHDPVPVQTPSTSHRTSLQKPLHVIGLGVEVGARVGEGVGFRRQLVQQHTEPLVQPMPAQLE